MMATSVDHQKQKRNLIKPRHIARSIVGQFNPLTTSPLRRASFVGTGILAKIEVPTLVFASQQQSASSNKQTTGSSTVTVQSTTSSDNEEVVSSPISTHEIVRPQTTSLGNIAVIINGGTVPANEQSSRRQIIDDVGSIIDVNITIVNNTPVSTSAMNNATSLNMNLGSSTTNGRNFTRGSPPTLRRTARRPIPRANRQAPPWRARSGEQPARR